MGGGEEPERTEVDFCPRRLPGLDARKEEVALEAGADERGLGVGLVEPPKDWNVCDLTGFNGGDGDSRSLLNCDLEEVGGWVGDFARSLAFRDGGRRVDEGLVGML